jgi:hypothetical protein
MRGRHLLSPSFFYGNFRDHRRLYYEARTAYTISESRKYTTKHTTKLSPTDQPISPNYISMSGETLDNSSESPPQVSEVSNLVDQNSSTSYTISRSTTIDGKVAEKTISCVSCRKRKLRCDRVKPQCGTCIRLRHDCEFPERRRNTGSKRRNMKELEARLGTSMIVGGTRKGLTRI